MSLTKAPKRHRFPVSLISQTVWLYYRFNHSYRDVQEQLAFRGITLSHETVRQWCTKFALHFIDVIKKHERKRVINGIWMKWLLRWLRQVVWIRS